MVAYHVRIEAETAAKDVLSFVSRNLSAQDRAWLAARLLEADDVDDQSDEYHGAYEAIFDLVDAKVGVSDEEATRVTATVLGKLPKKDYYVYFTLHVRLRLDQRHSAERARLDFEHMSDVDAVSDGKVLETEVTSVEEVK